MTIETPTCGRCRKEVFLVVKDGKTIERDGKFKACCECGFVGVSDPHAIEIMRRAEVIPHITLDAGPYANQYGSRVRDRGVNMVGPKPYEMLKVVA